MNERLRQFLGEYVDWIDAGAPHKKPFRHDMGLCSTFENWLFVTFGSYAGRSSLKHEFVADGLDENYPFGGQVVYNTESNRDALHLNEHRIAWVRSKVAQFEVV